MAKKLSLRPAVAPSRNAASVRRPKVGIKELIKGKGEVKTESNPEPIQKFTVKTEPKTTTKIVKLSQKFSIYGNRNGVQVNHLFGKPSEKGNLSTDYTRYVEVSGKPTYSYDGKKGIASYKVDFRFYAYEEGAGRKSGRDGLEFKKSITVSAKVGAESETIGIGTRNSDNTYDAYKHVEVSVEPFELHGKYGEAFYKGKYGSGNKSGFRNIDSTDASDVNRHQEWMSIDDVRVKFDGESSELYGTDNLAMEGRVTFYIKVTTTTWNEYTEETAAGKNSASVMNGSYPVLDADTIKSIRQVVGNGYDITGSYLNSSSLKGTVLNIDKLNSMQRIRMISITGTVRDSIKGDSLSEFSSTEETQLNVKVAASAFGASFSNDYNRTSKTEKKTSENRKFIKIRSLHKKKEYAIHLDYRNGLNKDFLDPLFLEELNSSTPEAIIQLYGTHVLLGGCYGASAFYIMSYIKSVSSLSKAESYTNTTTIGYKHGGGLEAKDKEEKEKKQTGEEKSAIAKLVDELGGIDKISDAKFKEILNAYKNGSNASADKKSEKKEEGDKDASGSTFQGTGGSVSVTKSESLTESQKFENESTDEKGIVYGGDNGYAADIRGGDLAKLLDWEKTLDASGNTDCWCDFVPGTIIPIYEFIPVGYKVTAEDVRKAWTRYIESKGQILVPTMQGMTQLFNGISVQGNSSVVKKLNDDCDHEISSEDRKCTGWKVRFELVNLDNGNVAVEVQYTVGEGGLNANRSLLMLHQPIEPANNEGELRVVDTMNYHNVYETEGEIWRKNSGFIDITRFFYDCPFLDFVNNPDNRVQIQLDGSGSNDSGNMKIKVDNFYIPVLTNVKD